ncbi:hypothetical protein JCM21900_001331 [Sporobolomyces salmonicolor]
MARSSISFTAALVALFFAVAARADNSVGSPNLYECTAAAFTYTCDNTPCTIVARPSADESSSLHNFGSVTAASGTVSWTVDEPQGTQVTMWITDSEGNTISSAALTVAAGSDSCLSSTASSGSSASSSAPTALGSSASSTGRAASSSSSAASSAASGASSVAGSATSAAASASSSADAASGAAEVFVKSSILAAAVLAAGVALF